MHKQCQQTNLLIIRSWTARKYAGNRRDFEPTQRTTGEHQTGGSHSTHPASDILVVFVINGTNSNH